MNTELERDCPFFAVFSPEDKNTTGQSAKIRDFHYLAGFFPGVLLLESCCRIEYLLQDCFLKFTGFINTVRPGGATC